MKLIIAEKPSVARAIASVLGVTENRDGYMQGRGMLVSWCVGHLVELALPEAYSPEYTRWRYKDLPIIPETWQYSVSKETEKQFAVLQGLMNDEHVTGIVCATDAGREGELIFRLVYEKAGCRKPVRRLWISSMEESAIREGFSNMKEMSAYDNLYKAALCRAQADWLIGMNATRLYSLLYGPTLHIGRVMTPTLCMLAGRENAIDTFEPATFYTVKLELGDSMTAHSERIDDLNAARALQTACSCSEAVIRTIEHEEKRENPPLLYDLTSLQREANRIYGFTAQQTLEYAQSLYEKRLLTYPRTDSQYLTHDMEPKMAELSSRVLGTLPFTEGLETTAKTDRVVNDGKVTDHHAIIPTDAMPGQSATVGGLPSGVKELLYLVCARFLCAMDEPFVYDEITVTVDCGGSTFRMKGRKVLKEGWKRIWNAFRKGLGARVPEEEESALPAIPEGLTEGRIFALPKTELTEGQTKPPAHHTEGTLLHAMETAGAADMPEAAERKGIGTPATRAAILEKLIETKLIERVGEKRKKVLVPTTKGKALAAVLPESLRSPLLTSAWEQRLQQIEQGAEKPEDFMRDIQAFVKELMVNPQRAEHAETLFPPLREKIGSCPKCGAAVTEHPQGYLCENRICGFALWKKGGILAHAETPLTAAEAKTLLTKGAVRKTGLHSTRTNARYDAVLHLDFGKDGRAILRPRFD